jgi:hypothetical protein
MIQIAAATVAVKHRIKRGWSAPAAFLPSEDLLPCVKIVAARIFSFHEKMAPTRICLIETDNNHPSHAYLVH